VSAQIGIAIALLCTSGALVKSLVTVLSVPPGFIADGVLTMQMMLPPALYPDAPSRARFVERMLENVRQVPGVVSAGTTQSTFLPNQGMATFLYVENITVENADRSAIRHITPGYFDALGVPIVEGRAIDTRDRVEQVLSKRRRPRPPCAAGGRNRHLDDHHRRRRRRPR
jgi:predicted secreted protein